MHIILGGTSGLGWEMAKLLRERGERVLVLGKFHNASDHGEGFAFDLHDEASVEWAVGELGRRLENEAIQYFVWAAGYGWRGNFGDMPDARSMAIVNFAGAVPFVQAAWRIMMAQEQPSTMVIISSTSGVKARPDEAVYVATKYAQTGLARSLGREVMRWEKSARVALFLLGGMKTRFWQGREPKHYKHYNDPAKVAHKVLDDLATQTDAYSEVSIPRGTLV
ncbi:MAG TPA: SDR family NAD(P)-dependent oxidoreductase [Candidatus Saccharibacteria bacterium]|nr:SDR family NAD(P)-dependent oxidoreductase [Candidatus Saccharibacteria bacterium]